jgi:SNF2 family DNA or RNA helicase
MPGFLSNESKFLSRYKVTDINEESSNRLSLLNQLITPFILRRKKKDVIKDLPEKINNNIFIDLSEKEKKLYASVVKDARDEMDRLIDKDGYQKAKFMILVLLTRLRQLCIDPKLVFDDKTLPSSKIENLIKVIKEIIENGHKILLFTSFKSALEIVKKELNKEKITNYTIDGSVSPKKRMELVNKFNQDDTNVFLIMLKSGGTGLNLTSADVVIHLDLWWNPQAENQATDRAHRIGQKNTVEVIKLITKGTIEEKILELQDKKKILSDKLIEGEGRDQSILDQLSEKELRNLFAFENKED